MNSRNHLWLLGGIVLAGLSACSSDEMTEALPDGDVVKTRRLTITETDNAAARTSQTRATLTDDGSLKAAWTAGDKLTYCNLSRTNQSASGIYSGNIEAVSTAATSQFTGDVTCGGGDYLAVVYPATTFETNESYTITLSGQDGTLEKLASTFHYVFGRAYVTSATDKTANATMEKMKSLLAVCKFSFIDAASSSLIPVRTLEISYGGNGSDAGKYPQTATVKISVNKEQADVHATGVADSAPLTITCIREQSAVYVALLPTNASRTYNFTVTNSSGTYTGTAKATLTEGEYIEATGLKLTKSNQASGS